eukprot:437056_1
MSELLFECYGVPSVCYGVDDLFSFYQNAGDLSDSLIVRSSASATYVVPVVGGRPSVSQSSRISIGGVDAVDCLVSHLHMRYPQHKAMLTKQRCEQLIHSQTYMSTDYAADLAGLASSADHNRVVIQLPYRKIEPPKRRSEAEIEAMHAKRHANGVRLQQLAMKRRQEKFQEQLDLLAQYREINNQKDMISHVDYMKHLRKCGFETVYEFDREYLMLDQKVQRLLAKQQGILDSKSTKSDAELYPLLQSPDSTLSKEQRREKATQRARKAAADALRRKKEEKERQKLQKEQEELLNEQKFNERPEAFIGELRRRKHDLMTTTDQRMKTREHSRKRKTSAARKRMRIIAEMGSGKMEENFGAEDSHWDVYRQVQGDDEGVNDDKERTELDEVNALLAKYDPESAGQCFPDHRYPRDEDYQISLSVDRIRVPEILYQPSLLGGDQGGLTDTIQRVLNRFDAETQTRLIKNVFVCGGQSKFSGFSDRLLSEIRAIRPVDSEIRIRPAADPLLDAWRGARKFANTPQFLEMSVSRAEYLENGGEYIKEHRFSNRLIPTVNAPSGVVG